MQLPDFEPDISEGVITSGCEDEPDDPQGIPWKDLQVSRAECRSQRLKTYPHFANASEALRQKYETLAEFQRSEIPDCLDIAKKSQRYPFHRNYPFVSTTIVHFQLRNLLWATTCHDLIGVHENSVKHWNVITQSHRTVIDLSGKDPALHIVGQVQISTACAAHGLVAAGGFNGEVVVANDRARVLWVFRVSTSNNCITNCLDITEGPSGAVAMLAANNDEKVRVLDIERTTVARQIDLEWAVNDVAASPRDRKLAAVVVDDVNAYLHDLTSTSRVATLPGHLDWGFAVAWHPGGHLLATGNQDCTTRLWDVRKLNASIAVLPTKMGAVRSCRFSPDGQSLAVAEPADFVHIYDIAGGLCQVDEIDLFGELSGISFTPDSEALYVASPDRGYASAVCYKRADGM